MEPESQPPGGGPVELRVLAVVEETSDAHSVVFEVPPDNAAVFEYRSGQFLTIKVPSELTGSVARSYSLASAPGIDRYLKVTVKRTVGGYASNWVCDNVRAGDLLTVLPPSGAFVIRRVDTDMLLFAAGSGVTPVISILKTALREGANSILLYYANRDKSSVIFDGELARLQELYPERLSLQHWYDDEHGFADAERITKVAAGRPGADAYLCGPPPFMDTVVSGLKSAGFESSRIHREVFLSLTGNPFEEEGPAAETAALDPRGGEKESVPDSRAIVHLAGETHEVDWPAERTLVDILLSNGIDVPYSCRSGECGSCACSVVEGEVEMAPSLVLDQEDLDAGYILGCQSRPRSSTVEILFE